MGNMGSVSWARLMTSTLLIICPFQTNAQIVQLPTKDTVLTGRVAELKILLENEQPAPGHRFYLEVTVVAGNDSLILKLPRGFSETVDEVASSGDQYWAVPYSAVAIAVISTLREALLSKKDVTVRGQSAQVMEVIYLPPGPNSPGGPTPIPKFYFLLREVTLRR
jgi:hypothetical protein